MYTCTPATEKAKQRRRIELIDMKPAGLELVFTGRYAHPRLIERADLCTEMREVKHYYQKGILARKGIES